MWSSERKNLAKALATARMSMDKLTFNKSANTGKFTYKYADLNEVYELAIPALYENNICVDHELDFKDNQTFVVTTLTHWESGEWVDSRSPLIPDKDGLQGMGGACTYIKRYQLNSLLGIHAEEDDDGNRSQGAKIEQVEKPKPKPEFVNEDQYNHILLELKDQPEIAQDVLDAFKIKTFRNIPSKHYTYTLNKIKELKEARRGIKKS
jgi:ERF superfamily